jgi:hypothetical protein
MGVIVKEILLEGSKGSKKVKALFDSGASMSFIKKSIAQKLGTVEKLPKPLEFETAKAGETLVVYEAVRLDFYLDDGDRLSDEFLVVSDEIMSEDCIIGASTFQKWRLVIDFDKENVYSARSVKEHILKRNI